MSENIFHIQIGVKHQFDGYNYKPYHFLTQVLNLLFIGLFKVP